MSLRAGELEDAPLTAPLVCRRLLFNDVASGARDGSVHLAEELKRPENSGLGPTIAALTAVKAKVDAAATTADRLSWADLVALAAAVITKRDFRRILAARYGGYLPPGINNEFLEPKIGAIDATAASTSTAVPPAGAPVAAWKELFKSLGLSMTELAALGPAVIGDDQAAAEAYLATDEELAPLLDYFERVKRAPARTPYELAFAKAVNKLAVGHGAVLDARRYTYDIKRTDYKGIASAALGVPL